MTNHQALHAHLLDMLGVDSHEAAGAEIGRLHALARDAAAKPPRVNPAVAAQLAIDQQTVADAARELPELLRQVDAKPEGGGEAIRWSDWPARQAMRDKYPEIAGDILDDVWATALAAAQPASTAPEAVPPSKWIDYHGYEGNGHDWLPGGVCSLCGEDVDSFDPVKQCEGTDDVFAAFKIWPDDIRRKLSAYDLRRMNGWAPRTKFGDWAIDTSAGRPILTYKACSVIEAEDARYVLSLIAKDSNNGDTR